MKEVLHESTVFDFCCTDIILKWIIMGIYYIQNFA